MVALTKDLFDIESPPLEINFLNAFHATQWYLEFHFEYSYD